MVSNIASELIYWTVIGSILVLLVFVLILQAFKNDPKKKIQKWMGISAISALILLILFVNELLPGAKSYYDEEFTQRITGRAMGLSEVYSYESYREPLLGDGYSIYLYKLDEESIEYFQHPDSTFFTDFPYKHADKRSNVVSWTKAPLNEEDSLVKRFAIGLGNNFEGPLSKLDKVQLFVDQLIGEQDAYYAYWANFLGSEVWNTSFYVLSPKHGYFVVVYSDM